MTASRYQLGRGHVLSPGHDPDSCTACAYDAGRASMRKTPGRSDRTVYRLTAADLDDLADRELTDEELDRFERAIDHSSVPEAVEIILDAVVRPTHPSETQ